MDAEKIRAAFAPIAGQKIDLNSVRGVNPKFTEKPKIDEAGLLILQGFYPTKPNEIHFTLKYIREEGEWKLFGIYVEPPVSALKMPQESQIVALANTNMRSLANAIRKDDFSDFYDSLASVWKEQTTRDQLRAQLSSFIEKKISLDPIAGVAPVFDPQPYLEGNGVLTLTGYYPTKPYRVDFKLRFVSEKQRWKLAGIAVSTSGP